MSYVIGRVHLEAVEASLERAALDSVPDVALPGLMTAAMIGNTVAVNLLLDTGLDANCADATGRTPLLEAVFGGHIDTVRSLLTRGADVNVPDADGWTALMEAAAKGRADLVSLLLADGADPSAKNKKGWTALRTTAKCNTEVSRMLRAAGAG